MTVGRQGSTLFYRKTWEIRDISTKNDTNFTNYHYICTKIHTIMKKDLNIMMDGKPLKLEEGCTIETNEVNPLTSGKPIYSSSVWL